MDVTLYTTPNCPWCKKAKHYLGSKKVRFIEVQVNDNQQAAQEMIKKSGQMGVPVVVVGDEVVVGFDEDKLDKLLSK